MLDLVDDMVVHNVEAVVVLWVAIVVHDVRTIIISFAIRASSLASPSDLSNARACLLFLEDSHLSLASYQQRSQYYLVYVQNGL